MTHTTDPECLACEEALERRLFQLKTLYDAAFELNRLPRPGEVVESFLLTVMGAMGVTQGFAMLCDRAEGTGRVHGRGFSKEELRLLELTLPQALAEYFSGPSEAGGAELIRPHLLSARRRIGGSPFPADTEVLVKWSLDENRCGFLGLGAKIRNAPYLDADLDFLRSLCANLLQALSRAVFVEDIERLNAALAAKSEETKAALEADRRLRAELDRRVLLLQSMNEAVSELGGILDSGELAQRFLLLAMGALGAGKAYLLLFSGPEKTRSLTCRGLVPEALDEADAASAYRLIARHLFADADRDASGLRRGFLDDPDSLTEAGLPPDMPGAWFVAEGTAFGFAGFGDRLGEEVPGAEERRFLLAHVGAFALFLKNVRLFEETARLNRELTERNEALRESLENLTRSRVEAAGLRAAKDRIASLVRQEVGRVRKVSVFDFLSILGVSLVLGLFYNFVHPGGVPVIPPGLSRAPFAVADPSLISARMRKTPLIIVDARPKEFFEQKRVKGAVNISPQLFDFVYDMRLGEADKAGEIVVYGRNVSSRYDEDVAELLRERGHENVTILSGGLDAWEEKGLAVEP